MKIILWHQILLYICFGWKCNTPLFENNIFRHNTILLPRASKGQDPTNLGQYRHMTQKCQISWQWFNTVKSILDCDLNKFWRVRQVGLPHSTRKLKMSFPCSSHQVRNFQSSHKLSCFLAPFGFIKYLVLLFTYPKQISRSVKFWEREAFALFRKWQV